jgi:hypothetical protein
LGIKTSFFINTGINRYTFINSKFIRIIKRFLDIKPIQLVLSYNIKGFNSKQAIPITYYIKLILLINGRKVLVSILVIGLGKYNMILG